MQQVALIDEKKVTFDFILCARVLNDMCNRRWYYLCETFRKQWHETKIWSSSCLSNGIAQLVGMESLITGTLICQHISSCDLFRSHFFKLTGRAIKNVGFCILNDISFVFYPTWIEFFFQNIPRWKLYKVRYSSRLSKIISIILRYVHTID